MFFFQKANGPDVQQELHDVLLQLMMGSSCDEHISLTAANILSCIAVYKSICREYLIANCLKSKNTLCQYNVSLASVRLVVAIVCFRFYIGTMLSC